ncbi:hypothetical protein EHF33_14050 [Deinococcus psychrotolerans]|uniref:Uncharacterized protein n=1 Tax=Deinococcus psychrotolerans TaxID=2489213 RepID=A0A3G8YQR9_9DEIO|nr:hypothetical protein [Deinococcus psychrotolerans]AZI44041.1 hypothetical protein EHF33_14050 [Deinococcus psychrotolerans]
MLGISQDWGGGIEEANQRLAEVLPLDRAPRPKDEVNARLTGGVAARAAKAVRPGMDAASVESADAAPVDGRWAERQGAHISAD